MDKEEKKIYPDISAETPGVPLVEGINSGAQVSYFTDETSSLSDRIAKAAANTNPPGTEPKDRGVAQDNVIDLSDENSSVESVGEQPHRGVPIKDEFHGVPISEDTVPTPVPTPEPEPLGRGKRTRTKPVIFSPKLKGKSHDTPSRSGHIHISVQEGDELSCDKYYSNCGYSTKRGVINLNLQDNVPPPRMTPEQVDVHLLGIALITQYNIKKGRELFGQKADDAILKELTEIDSFETYQPLHANSLTHEQKKKALEALFFLTEKRDNRIKGRKCAVGSKQRTYDGYDKSNGSSPTVQTDSTAGLAKNYGPT